MVGQSYRIGGMACLLRQDIKNLDTGLDKLRGKVSDVEKKQEVTQWVALVVKVRNPTQNEMVAINN